MKEEEKKIDDMKEEGKEDNPIGSFGFLLYNDKYNPKPLPKYH